MTSDAQKLSCVLFAVCLALSLQSCLPPTPQYPYEPPEKVLRDAQMISDQLEKYINNWADGKAGSSVPATLIPKGIYDSKNFYLKDPATVSDDEIWVVRKSVKIDFDSLYDGVPDPNATYFLYGPSLAPFGSKMVIEGEFPYCRFFDIQISPPLDGKNYTTKRVLGAAEVSMVDADIDPLPGNVNPFRVGAERNAKNRKYRLEIDMAKGDPVSLNKGMFAPPYRMKGNRMVGSLLVYAGQWGEKDYFGNTLAQGGKWNLGNLWIRIYAPDPDKGIYGGVALPKVWFELPNGKKYFLGANYPDLKERFNKTDTASTIKKSLSKTWGPGIGWFKGFGMSRGIMNGIAMASGWSRKDSATRINAIDRNSTGRGEFMPPPGNYEANACVNTYCTYLGRSITLDTGEVAVLTGVLPTFPNTRNRIPRMTSAQCRYFSICGYDYEFRPPNYSTGYVLNTVLDDQFVLNKNRKYVLVYSRSKDRPANANAADGVTWVNWGPTYELGLVIRWVTVSKDWEFELSPQEWNLTWAEADRSGSRYDSTLVGLNNHEGFLQCYLPRVRIMKRKEFESLGTSLKADAIPVWIDGERTVGQGTARKAKVSVSSLFDDKTQNQASNLTDQNLNTKWSSKWSSERQWVFLDLGRPTYITGIKLYWEFLSFAKKYEIMVSDDAVKWTPVFSTDKGDGDIDVINALRARGRYIGINMLQAGSFPLYGLYEFEVFSPEMNCTKLDSPKLPDKYQNLPGQSSRFDIQLIPNPAFDVLRIFLKNSRKDVVDLSLYHSSGRLISSMKASGNPVVVNIGSVDPGSYFVEARQGTARAVKQLFIAPR